MWCMSHEEEGGEGGQLSPSPSPLGGAAAGSARLRDDRGVARGWGRLVMAAFWVMGAVTVSVAIYQLFRDVSDPVGPRLVTFFAGLVYIGAAVGLTHNGRRMRKVAWACMSVAMGGPVIVGLSGLGVVRASDLWSPWTHFGQDTWFVSLVLPVVGFVWLWWSNPRRIVEIAEGLERVSKWDRKR